MNKTFILLLMGIFVLLSGCGEEKQQPQKRKKGKPSESDLILESEMMLEDTFPPPVEGANLLPGWDEPKKVYAVEQDFSLTNLKAGFIPQIIKNQVEGAEFIDGASWKDGNGNNYLGIFKARDKKKNLTNLLAFHAADLGNDRYRVLKLINDLVKDCEFDLILDLIPGSLTITDLDSNRYAEASFVYQMGCLSDVSPLKAKLMMLENGKKYAIRGMTALDTREDTYQLSANMDQLNDALKTYAQAQWDRFTDTTVYYWP